MSVVLYCVVPHTITNNFSSLQNSVFPFGPVNPIDFPFGQLVFNFTHPRKPLCSVAFGHIARGTRRLKGSKDRSEVNHVSLRQHSMDFLPRIPIQMKGNSLRTELGVYSGINVNVHCLR
ncbi:hypothetical protein AVEN_184678-1 [Araneus ventricosus]|uniref:Uncharacterized protein n=1 Tax=Araneus ventricosus TaxID=182803 RepID=A0A4Y2FT89_ARAVE|nr:hypothetical protein AVEN_184678-1 [Araneus ventricosus]